MLNVFFFWLENVSQLVSFDKFYFTFEFEYRMWAQVYPKFKKDQIPICHFSKLVKFEYQ